MANGKELRRAEPIDFLKQMDETVEQSMIQNTRPRRDSRGNIDYWAEGMIPGKDILRGQAVTIDNKTLFRINDFMEFLEKHRFKEFKLHEVTAHLKERGAKHEAKKVKGKHVNIWIIPEFEKQQEDFTEPNIEEVF